MKRLLLAPLLIAGLQSPANALPWGNEIVVKTELGEKFILKDSSVSIKYDTKDSLIQIYKGFLEDDRRDYANCIAKGTGKRRCKDRYLPEARQAKYRQTINDYQEQLPDKKIRATIYFTPIFQDLNGIKSRLNKVVLGQTFKERANCINTSLSKEDQILLGAWGSDGYAHNAALNRYEKEKDTALFKLKLAACKKYAKF